MSRTGKWILTILVLIAVAIIIAIFPSIPSSIICGLAAVYGNKLIWENK